jgi:hypothetical protein
MRPIRGARSHASTTSAAPPYRNRLKADRSFAASARGQSSGILSRVLAGFLLVLGGGLIALGSRQDLLTAHLAGGESATLNVAGTRFGTALLVFAALIAALGVARIVRGYAKDAPLHQIAAVASLAAIATVLARAGLFLIDHNLSIGSPSSYGHLGLALGVYALAGGVVLTLISKLS